MFSSISKCDKTKTLLNSRFSVFFSTNMSFIYPETSLMLVLFSKSVAYLL